MADWRIEVIYPDSDSEIRWYRFREGTLAKLPSDGGSRFAHGHTSVTATLITMVLRGEVTRSAAEFGLGQRRVHTRLYEVTGDGSKLAGTASDDPIAIAVFQQLDERYVERELARLDV